MARGGEESAVDALVVGAGPAGLSAARHLHAAGVGVLLVDARSELGTPLRCAEATRPAFFEVLELEPARGWIRWRIEAGPIVLDRHLVESGVGQKLAELGVEVRAGCAVVGVGPYERGAREVELLQADGTRRVRARVVIAADGVSSRVARLCGLDTRLSLLEVASTLAYRMEGLLHLNNKLAVLDYLPELSPHYFWIIPTGEHSASVGLGIPGHRGHLARPLLDRLVAEHQDQLAGGRTIERAVGWYPSVQPLATPYAEGLLVVGGAARLVGAESGEGIWQGAVSGREAARSVVRGADGTLRVDGPAYRTRLNRIYDELALSWAKRRAFDARAG
jgi:digeranylgeranylglycerophospholipid reductase